MSERDETGRFTGMSSEKARENANKSWESRKRTRETADELLIEAGYADPGSAPAHLRVLARQASRDGGNSVSALEKFLLRTGRSQEVTGQLPELVRGQPCPVCKRIFWEEIKVDRSRLEMLVDLLMDDIENGKGAKHG